MLRGAWGFWVLGSQLTYILDPKGSIGTYIILNYRSIYSLGLWVLESQLTDILDPKGSKPNPELKVHLQPGRVGSGIPAN